MAATNGNRPIRGGAYSVTFPIVNNSTGKTISGATAVAGLLSKDGGAFQAVTNTITEIGTEGEYYLNLTAGEMDCAVMRIRVTSTSPNAKDVSVEVRTESGVQSGTAQTGSVSTIRLATAADSTHDDFYNGCRVETVKGTGAGQVRTGIDYVSANRTLTVDRDWAVAPAADTVYILHPARDGVYDADGTQRTNAIKINDSTTAASLLQALYDGALVKGTVNDAGATTTNFIGAAGLSTEDDFYSSPPSICLFTSGTLAGKANKITAYDGDTLTLAFTTAWPDAPANGDKFVILGVME